MTRTKQTARLSAAVKRPRQYQPIDEALRNAMFDDDDDEFHDLLELEPSNDAMLKVIADLTKTPSQQNMAQMLRQCVLDDRSLITLSEMYAGQLESALAEAVVFKSIHSATTASGYKFLLDCLECDRKAKDDIYNQYLVKYNELSAERAALH